MNIEIKNLSLTYPNGKQALKEVKISIYFYLFMIIQLLLDRNKYLSP